MSLAKAVVDGDERLLKSHCAIRNFPVADFEEISRSWGFRNGRMLHLIHGYPTPMDNVVTL